MEKLVDGGIDNATNIITNENILKFFSDEYGFFIVFVIIILVFIFAFTNMLLATNSMRQLSNIIMENNILSKAENDKIKEDISHLKETVVNNANNNNYNLQNLSNVLHELRTDINEQKVWCQSRNQN